MSSVGLVLGGGGITGAAYEFATTIALRLATGWDPGTAEVIVGTSSGATVAAAARGGALTVEAITANRHTRDTFSEYLGNTLLQRCPPTGWTRWVRYGLRPRLSRPGIDIALGGPALFDPHGIGDYVEELVGPVLAKSWPDQLTYIVAYDLDAEERVVFGHAGAPEVSLREAVAASSAVPMVFQPVELDGRHYVDGGVVSGTNIDLLLDIHHPLDVVIIVAPMAADEERSGARFYEGIFDRIGARALHAELELLEERWPSTDFIVLRPNAHVLDASRPNPLSPHAAVPTFLRTLAFLRRELATPQVWNVLNEHLVSDDRPRPG